MTDYWVLLVSYIIGLFPSAYIAGRLVKGVDIRKVGDRNAGAANVYRNINHVAGMAVLAGDIGKGALAVLLAQAVASQPIVLLCGVAVVAGHNWPIFLRFKGGRGLATTIGVLLVLLAVPMTILQPPFPGAQTVTPAAPAGEPVHRIQECSRDCRLFTASGRGSYQR